MPKVISDTHREVVKHYRTIEIQDGPLIDAGGDGPYASYYPGTMFKADRLKMEWIGEGEPMTVEVSGPYVGEVESARHRYNQRYRTDNLPDWIKEILQ